MQFAKAQTWGRSAKLCLTAVTSRAYSGLGPILSERTVDSLKISRACLAESKPREITAAWDVPYFVFTDASFSPTMRIGLEALEVSWLIMPAITFLPSPISLSLRT